MVSEVVPTADSPDGRTGTGVRDRRLSHFNRFDRLALTVVLLIHLGGVLYFFPPWEAVRSEPLWAQDHSVHTYRVFLYREAFSESGLPWGYDPALSAGSVTNPGQDVGAKPQQILGLLLPMLPPGMVVRLFLFVAALTFPLWVFLACRRMGIPARDIVWIMLILVLAGWFTSRMNVFWRAGLTAFMFATYFSVFVLSVFVNFVEQPDRGKFLLLTVTSVLLLMLHVVGPLIVLLPLAYLTLTVRGIPARWRALLWLVPVIVFVFNSFWVVPLLYSQHIPQPVGFASHYPPMSVAHNRLNDFSELASYILSVKALFFIGALAIAGYGIRLIARRSGRVAATALGISIGWGLFVTYFGSFTPILTWTQPARFLVATFAFLSIPLGVVVSDAVRRLRVPSSVAAIVVALVGLAPVIIQGRGRTLELPPEDDPLARFVENSTVSTDRLLIQSPDGYRYGHYESKTFPITMNREVLGSNFPVIYDPPQFLSTMLLGRQLSEWKTDELRAAIARWGMSWAFTVTPQADSLMARTVGEPGLKVGNYRAFAIPNPADRFLLGSGHVEASVNRMDLSDLRPDRGLVVLRYRYHPGWAAPEGVPIRKYAVPEDPSGFLALVNPPSNLTLRFEPWKMLRAQWPEEPINPSQPDSL